MTAAEPGQVTALLAPEALAALFRLAYRAGAADARSEDYPIEDRTLARLRTEARDALLHEQTGRSFTLADLCEREALPLPPADDGVSAFTVRLRAYRAPTRTEPTWTLTNTGGRRYRFALADPHRVERKNGSAWEETPASQVPVAVLKLQQALALAGHLPGVQRQIALALGDS